MKEYGGYLEFEHYTGKEFHENLLALNSGRNCLAHLIDVKKIRKVYLPLFLGDSVRNLCDKWGVEVEYYAIDEKFQPIFEKKLKENEYLYVVNFYGQLSREFLCAMQEKYGQVIADYAQSFFEKPLENVDTIYVPKKFFGVADGGYLATDSREQREYEKDVSLSRMEFLLGRFEKTASEYYEQYKENEANCEQEPVKTMSALTQNLLRGVDYAKVRERREKNFRYLHEKLQPMNELQLNVPIGPFAYPLLIPDGYKVRKRLQEQKIYIPTLWPNVLEECGEETLEYRYARDILPIPVDQRYDTEDMAYLAEKILEVCREV